MEKAKVRVVFTASPAGRPSWPYMDYDVDSRSRKVTEVLRSALPGVELAPVVYRSLQEAEEGYRRDEEGRYDVWLIYMMSMWQGIALFYAERGLPVVFASEPFSGDGEFLRTFAMAQVHQWRAVGVGSSDLADVANAVRVATLLRRLRESRILLVTDRAQEQVAKSTGAVKELFGTEVVRVTSDGLRSAYEAAPESEAQPIAQKWLREAQAVVEPDEQEVLRSARVYLALKRMMQEQGADAVTVDCLGLYYAGKLPAYPCLAFFQLNNEGSTGVCEGDLDSTLTQLVFRYLSGKPGYVSDPVIDTAANQVIYAHCVATDRPDGPGGPAYPYEIRSHAEDGKGASVQSFLPAGRTVTTAKISTAHRAMGLYTARTVGNVREERACRTKLAAEVDAEKLLRNYHSDVFGWHQVTAYGDYRTPMRQFAQFAGLTLYEQDR